MSDNAAAIARLTRHFGNLDKEVLAAVLEVCNGDAKEAERFLQAQDGGGYDARTLQSTEGGLPRDYPGQKPAAPARYRGVPQAAPPKPAAATAMSSAITTQSVAATLAEQVERTKALFLSDSISYQEHYDAQRNSYDVYAAVLLLLLKHGVEISKASRPRVLASCWARSDTKLANHLLAQEDTFGLAQVLAALNLLDAGRKVRAIEKRVARLERQGTVKTKRLNAVKNSINDLQREAKIGSVSGALSKRLRAWVRTIPASQLEFFALNMPKQPWMELADLIHANPRDFQCPWFLPFVFGAEPPADSVIVKCRTLSADNAVDILQTWPVPYSYLRLTVKPIPEAAKPLIAAYSPLDTVIWYHEELACTDVDQIIETRLATEVPKFGYGKLMERLLYFRSLGADGIVQRLMPVAEERLRAIDLQLEAPVVVVGDASYSMDVAIRTATVIGSVLAALCNAELKFFTGVSLDPPVVPRSVRDVLHVADTVKANGLTAPAAVLWPYYKQKKVVKLFIVVTDEIENEKADGVFFPTLFKRYHDEVYPAKIVFVSFLQNANEKGRMVTALESMGIVPLQFRLDGRRPDLTKLDHLLGVLGSETSFFPQQCRRTKCRR
eukprot:TRINITY_DN4788_c0_g1_i3.p1 TRINITY_DN4788_c0_g1~~TRINITY_DN4788_c0_g1_i3.p1  ORF type:complete len:610 (-),score=284.50 TRINITY_DN4788_c0_g1_i3:264-2093(-)